METIYQYTIQYESGGTTFTDVFYSGTFGSSSIEGFLFFEDIRGNLDDKAGVFKSYNISKIIHITYNEA